jgi:polynucleotide 5'-kinase involved in rRNA processing
MIQEVQKDQTLLVKGPSRVTLLEGKVEVFGKEFSPKKSVVENTLIVPSANSFPLFALETSKLEIFTNSSENIEIVEENTITKEWVKIKDSVLNAIKKNEGKKPLKLMVLGLSNGKTSLIKYLANNILYYTFLQLLTLEKLIKTSFRAVKLMLKKQYLLEVLSQKQISNLL